MNFERALYWVNVGAQPTDTVRTILSNEGVLLMKHLQGGVKKGAFDEAEAQKRFDAWKAQKQAAIDAVSYTHLDVYKRQVLKCGREPDGMQAFVLGVKRWYCCSGIEWFYTA